MLTSIHEHTNQIYKRPFYSVTVIQSRSMDRFYLENLRNIAILEFLLKNKQRNQKQTWDKESKVFIGGLKFNVGRSELIVSKLVIMCTHIHSLFQDIFSRYGHVVNCWVARRPGGFGFVQMQSRREAKRSVRELHGSYVHGYKDSKMNHL